MVTDSGLALPVASPLHDTNCQPTAGLGVSSTMLPSGWPARSGFFATVPLPVTSTWGVWVISSNVAVTDLAASMVTAIGFWVPVTAPLQDVKRHPASGVAVSVTEVPCVYVGWSGD